jgi:hypothetical protein
MLRTVSIKMDLEGYVYVKDGLALIVEADL